MTRRLPHRRAPKSRARPVASDAETDRGSAVAEFVMVVALLLLLFLALLQVTLWAYARTLVGSAASEAARYSSLADAGAADVTARVADRLGDGIGSGMKTTLICSTGADQLTVEVHCTMEAPGLVGVLDGVMPAIDVTGRSAREDVLP